MKIRCACLALCCSVLPALTVSAEAASPKADSLPAAKVVTPAATAAQAEQAKAAEAAPASPQNAAPAASAPPPTVAAPPTAEKAADAPPGPIAVGPYTLKPTKFGQKADTVTISGEVSGGKACRQLTIDFSLRNPVQPQDLILRETIEDYDPKTPRPFERNAAAINDVRAWKSWEMAYVSLQCINSEGHMNRYTAQPKQ